MAIVEQTFFRWTIVRRDADKLYVLGQRSSAGIRSRPGGPSHDLLRAYRDFGSEVPHVQFANARTDEDLITFVQRHGPVNGSWQAPGPLARRKDSPLEVIEDLQRLRRERMVFASALQTLCGLRDAADKDVANGLGDFVCACSQPGPAEGARLEIDWIMDLLLRAQGDGLKGGALKLEGFLRQLRGVPLREYGWYLLSVMLRAFPPEVVPVEGGLIELPKQDNAGILPSLFFMLRRDCLDGQEIKICCQRDCRKFFRESRAGQRFCSAECSQLQRQRDYWQRKGKKARAVREASKRKRKGGK